jgi:hypothetical protein
MSLTRQHSTTFSFFKSRDSSLTRHLAGYRVRQKGEVVPVFN